MVKRQNKDSAGKLINQGGNGCPVRATKIGASTAYEYCSERLSPFGGLLGLVKFMDAVKFKEIFDGFYKLPTRTPELGHYSMVYGIIMLLFIGFNRIWHFVYIRIDPMLCSIFNVVKLPYVTTYWRYVDSLGINQGKSLLDVMSALRERVWQLCGISYRSIRSRRFTGNSKEGGGGIIPRIGARRDSVPFCVLSRRPVNILLENCGRVKL